ncbi:MAG TPA: hypothetical protein VJ824_16030 [Bacillota bacterium]|nr:hypothetical protein [Bacillota bacterium]
MRENDRRKSEELREVPSVLCLGSFLLHRFIAVISGLSKRKKQEKHKGIFRLCSAITIASSRFIVRCFSPNVLQALVGKGFERGEGEDGGIVKLYCMGT